MPLDIPDELHDEFRGAGYPPLPRTEASYLEDEYNFKKAIMNPKEPVDDKDKPIYTSTMALGNLDTDEVHAMLDQFRISRILDRYNYPKLVKSRYYSITDLVVSSQSHQAKLLAALTIHQFGMHRVESSNLGGSGGAEDSGNPIANFINSIRNAPKSGENVNNKANETLSRYKA